MGIRNLHSVKLAHISVSVIFFLYKFPLLNSCLFFGSTELRLRKLYVLDRRVIGGGVSSYISSERARLGLCGGEPDSHSIQQAPVMANPFL